MDIFLFIVTVVNIQGALSCPAWTFPEDITGDCCERKEIGDEVYLYLTTSEYEWKQFDCVNHCVYYKQGDSVLNNRYCFIEGGEKTFKCSNGTSQCNADTEVKVEYEHSIEIFSFDLDQMLRLIVEFKKRKHTFNNFLIYMYEFTMNVFSPAQQRVFQSAPPCSDVKIKCDLCFEALTDSSFQCYEDSTDICKKTLPRINETCRACACLIGQDCQPGFQCQKGQSGDDNEIAYTTTTTHPCDRNCSGSAPMTCVFNFTLKSQSSGTDGPRVDGRKRTVLAYNGQVPGPPIVICEGDNLVVNLTNGLTEPTTLHFHGIREKYRPWKDGVPNVTQCAIRPNKTFAYGFEAFNYFGAPTGSFTQAGTYWYHSHFQAQRTDGAYGALIIRPRQTQPETRFDEDEWNSTIILQEWYESHTDKTLRSLLINGNGHVDSQDFETTYTVFTITKPGKIYLFRVIGAISENVPLRLSIEGHNFTAIAADSQDIKPVEDLTHLWIAGGERFHIVVQTKEDGSYSMGSPYKIKVFGYGDIGNHADTFCTIAWLKYPGQTVDPNYKTPANCNGFADLPSFHRTLNPVPNNYTEWEKRLKFPGWKNKNASGNIYISDLRAVQGKPSISVFGLGRNNSEGGLNNTNYLELTNNSFNGLRLNFSGVPILLQNETYLNNHKSERCGQECTPLLDHSLNTDPNLPAALRHQYLRTHCADKRPTRCATEDPCYCEHVTKQPYAPGYWADTLLINNNMNDTAHPIHIHGGWSWVMGMGQFPFPINRTFIQGLNEACEYKDHCLWTKNITLPPAKDTIQVPTGGYVLLRTPLDNKGAWFMHCHINKHLQQGMAMVLQIGGFGYNKTLAQDWCTGPLEINDECKQD